MAQTTPPRSAQADDAWVTFSLPDRHGRLRAVRLLQEIGLRARTDLARHGGAWQLQIPVPEVDRMEYLFEIEDHNGRRSTVTDPGNPLRAGGAFGDKSEVRFSSYRPPEWLDWPPASASAAPLQLAGRHLGADLTGALWSPNGLESGQPAPLLVVHDGPEYAAIGSFTGYLAAVVEAGIIPPVRAALLGPVDRNTWYSANPTYARALYRGVLSGLDAVAPATVRVGMGVSLGGLAVLHAHRAYPKLFDALFLQSGSFFTPQLDPQERDFSGFAPVAAFVAEMHGSARDDHPVPTVLTCGAAEENLGNNRAMADTLGHLGYPTTLIELRDAHNYTAWRDALHPHLTRLIAELVADRAA